MEYLLYACPPLAETDPEHSGEERGMCLEWAINNKTFTYLKLEAVQCDLPFKLTGINAL